MHEKREEAKTNQDNAMSRQFTPVDTVCKAHSGGELLVPPLAVIARALRGRRCRPWAVAAPPPTAAAQRSG